MYGDQTKLDSRFMNEIIMYINYCLLCVDEYLIELQDLLIVDSICGYGILIIVFHRQIYYLKLGQ